MMSTILIDLGYVPEFKFYDWPLAEIHLETGYPGLAFPFIKSKERVEKGFRFSDALHTFDYVLFYHKDREQTFSSITALKDIQDKGLKIGRLRGYAKLASLLHDKNYIEIPNAATGFQMLQTGNDGIVQKGKQIDFLLESKAVGLAALESSQISYDKDDFRFLGQDGRGELISRVSLRVMISPKLDASILHKINLSIKENKEFFDSLRTRTGSNDQVMAFLAAPVGEIIYGYGGKAASTGKFMIPQNSSVLITEWGQAYSVDALDNHLASVPGRTQVKLLSGPLKGKVVWVGSQYITLESKEL
jgi:hypothetical protein